jgi:hypothetical protein
MLKIATLTLTEIRAIEREAMASFHHRGDDCAKLRDPEARSLAMRNCQACSLRALSEASVHEEDGAPCVAGWELAWIASARVLRHGWAARVFATLGEDSAYGARLRGYLMVTGVESLHFEPE